MNVISEPKAPPLLDAQSSEGASDRDVGDDYFFRQLAEKLPSDVLSSFSRAQLLAITEIFGTRRWRKHPVDFRWLVPLLGRSYYFVLLIGSENRSSARLIKDRLLRPLATFGNGVVAVIFFTSILVSVLITLYMLKSFLGINILPDFSFGVLPIVKQEFKMLFG